MRCSRFALSAVRVVQYLWHIFSERRLTSHIQRPITTAVESYGAELFRSRLRIPPIQQRVCVKEEPQRVCAIAKCAVVPRYFGVYAA